VQDFEVDGELVQDRPHNAADGAFFAENFDPGILPLPKVLSVLANNLLAEVFKPAPASGILLVARFINDPRPRDGPVFARDDEHSRDVPHAAEAHILDQATGE
jgi:hypothetical protein